MKRINFVTTLLLVLFLCTVSRAQERGDGLATPKNNDKGIITGRTGPDNGNGQIIHGTNSWFDKNMMLQYWTKHKDGTPFPFTLGLSEFGVNLGGNFQEMAHSPFTKSFKPGLVGGLYYRRYWRLTAVKVELLGSTAHYVSTQAAGVYATHPTDSTSKSFFKTRYFSLPVLAQLMVVKDVYLELGPQYSYMLSYSEKNGVFSKIYGPDNIFKNSEFSMIIGAEAKINRKFKFDLRYIKGMTDVNNSVYPSAYLQWNINAIQATVYYRLY